jgi:hypothetical protein
MDKNTIATAPIIVDYYIELENLLEGRSSASVIDLKMGTSTVTCNIKTQSRIEKRHLKDASTTTAKLGLRVIGYVIKSREKEIEEKYYKFPQKSEREIMPLLRRIFSWPHCNDCGLCGFDSCGEVDLNSEKDENRESKEKHLKNIQTPPKCELCKPRNFLG